MWIVGTKCQRLFSEPGEGKVFSRGDLNLVRGFAAIIDHCVVVVPAVRIKIKTKSNSFRLA